MLCIPHVTMYKFLKLGSLLAVKGRKISVLAEHKLSIISNQGYLTVLNLWKERSFQMCVSET